jgi:hypothetical protein
MPTLHLSGEARAGGSQRGFFTSMFIRSAALHGLQESEMTGANAEYTTGVSRKDRSEERQGCLPPCSKEPSPENDAQTVSYWHHGEAAWGASWSIQINEPGRKDTGRGLFFLEGGESRKR